MNAAARHSHLVGTVPSPDARQAMELCLSELGASLATLPDGETGKRQNWVMEVIEGLRRNPDLELAREGDWSDYDKVPRFKVKRGGSLRPETLELGYARFFEQSYPAFADLARAHGRPELDFQVGVPGDFDMALFSLGPAGAFRNRRPFTEATLREIRAIHAARPEGVVFQIEVPAELVFVARMPPPLMGPMARHLAGVITSLVRQSPEGARFGVHLCLGDMNHRALARMKDTRPVVCLANAIAKRWPEGRPLDFIHAPFAAAIEPPSTDPAWYRPLERLRLPDSTRFVAGFAHEGQELATQVELRSIIETAIGRPVDISTSCGLGRRSPDEARAALRRTAELVSGS